MTMRFFMMTSCHAATMPEMANSKSARYKMRINTLLVGVWVVCIVIIYLLILWGMTA
jgi:hypothetical protein